MRLERRAEERRNKAIEGTEDRWQAGIRIEGATTAVANLRTWVGRVVKATVSRERGSQAGIREPQKESDVREVDGRGRHRGESAASGESGETQSWSGWDRPHGDDRSGRPSAEALAEDTGKAVDGDLGSESGEAGRDTEAERGHKNIRDSNGDRSSDPADATAGADADL